MSPFPADRGCPGLKDKFTQNRKFKLKVGGSFAVHKTFLQLRSKMVLKHSPYMGDFTVAAPLKLLAHTTSEAEATQFFRVSRV